MSSVKLRDQNERIAWVDILRFLGMSLIYWGHLGVSNNIVLYIFSHHVPLFFFISGFFATLLPKEGSFLRFLWKKVRGIIFPYIFFTILFYAVQLATGQIRFAELPSALLVSALGIRNRVPGPLWFFTCLFIVVIAFELIKRIVSAVLGSSKAAKVVVFLIAAALYVVGICFLGHEPAQSPEWFWNVDSAFVYIFYYALGALFFPLIRKWKYREKRSFGKVLFFVFFALSLAFAVFTCLQGAAFTAQVEALFQDLFIGHVSAEILFELYALISALIMIFFELCIARMIALIPAVSRFLAFVGKDSLYHCGNELIVKYFGGLLISYLGLRAFMNNDWFLLLYSIVCMIVLTFTLNLLERLLLGRIFGNGQFSFHK